MKGNVNNENNNIEFYHYEKKVQYIQLAQMKW